MISRLGWARCSVVFVSAFLALAASRCSQGEALAENETGKKALQWTKEITDLGPRPPGSASLAKVRTWVEKRAVEMGATLKQEPFQADTPIGQIEMINLSYVLPGQKRDQRVFLVAHYDSKRFLGFDFVGANDAASSVALLLALSPEIVKRKFPFDTEVILVDGEEAIERWTAKDSLYGSRHLAENLTGQKPVRAALVVDGVGDPDLIFTDEQRSDARLKGLFKEVLSELNLENLYDTKPSWTLDDHIPLINAGVPTLHIMDYSYGDRTTPGKYWHTKEDTVGKVSARSLSVTGEVILKLLDKIAKPQPK